MECSWFCEPGEASLGFGDNSDNSTAGGGPHATVTTKSLGSGAGGGAAAVAERGAGGSVSPLQGSPCAAATAGVDAGVALRKADKNWAAERAEAVLLTCMHTAGGRMDRQAAFDAEAVLRASAGSVPFSRPVCARRGIKQRAAYSSVRTHSSFLSVAHTVTQCTALLSGMASSVIVAQSLCPSVSESVFVSVSVGLNLSLSLSLSLPMSVMLSL
jgi:hypothetical protein